MNDKFFKEGEVLCEKSQKQGFQVLLLSKKISLGFRVGTLDQIDKVETFELLSQL